MMLLKRLIAIGTCIIGGLWLICWFGFITTPSNTLSYLWAAFLILSAIRILLDWRTRTENHIVEPSPAKIAIIVILLTGFAAVIMTARSIDSNTALAVPVVIAALTLLSAGVVGRFASKCGERIGEARFDTSGNER